MGFGATDVYLEPLTLGSRLMRSIIIEPPHSNWFLVSIKKSNKNSDLRTYCKYELRSLAATSLRIIPRFRDQSQFTILYAITLYHI